LWITSVASDSYHLTKGSRGFYCASTRPTGAEITIHPAIPDRKRQCSECLAARSRNNGQTESEVASEAHGRSQLAASKCKYCKRRLGKGWLVGHESWCPKLASDRPSGRLTSDSKIASKVVDMPEAAPISKQPLGSEPVTLTVCDRRMRRDILRRLKDPPPVPVAEHRTDSPWHLGDPTHRRR
jgi:hypothetical protein